MNLDFSAARWVRIRESYRQWWDGSLRRPLIHVCLTGRDPGRPKPDLPTRDYTSFYDDSVSAEAIADRWLYDLECRRYIGDAFPQVFPNFGPGVIAAFLGLELQNGNGTVWFHQPRDVALADLDLRFDPDNRWFRRVCDIYGAAADRFEGLAHLGMTDLGGNLDILQSFRPGDGLALDVHDAPGDVERKTWDAHALWWRCFDELNRIIQPAHAGYSAWTPLYSETPYYMLQCDFAFMIGPDMFERFAKPELVASCHRLGNPFYHLDGPGQLPHLDSLLAIPELKGIQWVPGAGQPPVSDARWIDIYRRIRAAGKRIQFFTSQDPLGWRTLDVLAQNLGGAEGIMMCGEAPAEDAAGLKALLEKYGAS
jgi:5-methyltetrahydrofolate--homocysteine methyltransferase